MQHSLHIDMRCLWSTSTIAIQLQCFHWDIYYLNFLFVCYIAVLLGRENDSCAIFWTIRTRFRVSDFKVLRLLLWLHAFRLIYCLLLITLLAISFKKLWLAIWPMGLCFETKTKFLYSPLIQYVVTSYVCWTRVILTWILLLSVEVSTVFDRSKPEEV